MPKRPDETMESFVIRLIKNEIYEECAALAEGNAPRNEPEPYWRGRFDAADKIREKIDN